MLKWPASATTMSPLRHHDARRRDLSQVAHQIVSHDEIAPRFHHGDASRNREAGSISKSVGVAGQYSSGERGEDAARTLENHSSHVEREPLHGQAVPRCLQRAPFKRGSVGYRLRRLALDPGARREGHITAGRQRCRR